MRMVAQKHIGKPVASLLSNVSGFLDSTSLTTVVDPLEFLDVGWFSTLVNTGEVLVETIEVTGIALETAENELISSC